MSLIPYYPVKHARGMLIFSSDLLDDTSVELIWKMVLSTCEKWPTPQPPLEKLQDSTKL